MSLGTSQFQVKKPREEKSIHHHRGDPPFFLFPGLRLYGVYPSFRTYGVYPCPLFSQENGIHHSFFYSVTSGSGDRPRKKGSRGGGVYSFFPLKPWEFFDGKRLHGGRSKVLFFFPEESKTESGRMHRRADFWSDF